MMACTFAFTAAVATASPLASVSAFFEPFSELSVFARLLGSPTTLPPSYRRSGPMSTPSQSNSTPWHVCTQPT
jgi:hypothetical protein